LKKLRKKKIIIKFIYFLFLISSTSIICSKDGHPRVSLNSFKSVTAIGTVYRPQFPEGNILRNQYNAWIQDVTHLRLRYEQGKPGETQYMAMYLFENAGYIVQTKDGDPNSSYCVQIPATYNSVVSVYAWPVEHYFTTGKFKQYNVNFFAGVSKDESVGSSIPNILMVDTDGGCFRGYLALTESGYMTFLYPDCTVGDPKPSWYDLPQICLNLSKTSKPSFLQTLSTRHFIKK